jgi:hypothetical protein
MARRQGLRRSSRQQHGVPADARESAPSPLALDAVVSHHLNPFRSGAARFNITLAERLNVPCIGILDERVPNFECPMLSFKVAELGSDEREVVEHLLAEGRRLRVFLHDYTDSALERRMVRHADTVYCGNDEVREQAEPLARRTRNLWAPGLISDTRRFEPTSLNIFSFGMAHKIQVGMFARLRELLESTGKSYAIYVSNANHETATIEDAQMVYEEMDDIFPARLYFTGNLSDVAIYNWLIHATFYAAFFPRGVRANNTSVASALEHGAVVVTNLDRHSPPYLVHMDNVIDINQCEELPTDPAVLEALREGARRTSTKVSWEALVAAIRDSESASGTQ